MSLLAALHGFTREEMYEARRILEVGATGLAAERATPENLRDAAEAHRRIYQAIRLRDAEGARRAMKQHLTEALQYQKQEPGYPAMSASISSSDA